MDREFTEQRFVKASFGFSDPIDESVVAAVVTQQHGAHHIGGQMIMEGEVQKGEPGGFAGLHLWNQDNSSCIASADSHEHLALRRHPVLGSTENTIPVDAARQITRDPAAVDDRDRVAVDVVPRVAAHIFDSWVQICEDLERAVAEYVSACAGSQYRLDERPVDDTFITARDADRHRLGLVFDRVDGSRQLLDSPRE